MLYPFDKSIKLTKKDWTIWVTQKNTEAEEKWALKKEEQEKKIKRNNSIKVLYGGSVNPNNVNELSKIKEIEGFLIGGASLNAKKFVDIIKKSSI